MKAILFTLLALFTNVALSEGYNCSVELSNFGGKGQYESSTYVRKGDYFLGSNKFFRNEKFNILQDSPTTLIIYKINKHADTDSVSLKLISKNKMKFTETFIHVDDDSTVKRPSISGECTIFN